MTQPAFGVICDICRDAAPDPYLADGMTVCEGCWDPFGTFDHVSERRSQYGVDRVEGAMLLESKTGPAGNRTLTPTQSLRSCVMAESILPHPAPSRHPHGRSAVAP